MSMTLKDYIQNLLQDLAQAGVTKTEITVSVYALGKTIYVSDTPTGSTVTFNVDIKVKK